MNKRWWFLFGGAAVTAAMIATITPSRAFDHEDSPKTVSDPAVDIADVYAFMRPEPDGAGGYLPSTHLVLVMTMPLAAGAPARFDPRVDYIFRVRRVNAGLALQPSPNFKVTCTATTSTPQKMLCNANGVAIATVDVDAVAGAPTDKLRIYAGAKSDPAFADVAAFKETISTRQNKFKTPGTNTFQGKNVLAIVAELDVQQVALQDAAAPLPIFAVAGETKRN